jgi:hypothetical protein
MNEVTTSNEHARAWASGWITAMLSIAAAVAMAFGIWLALGTNDTEPFESPLMLSVARQLERGPWGLYGPFGARNPLVLIHAPLYYHMAAILALPLKSAGLDSITAARLAGRALSLLGLLLTAWSALRIARLDGAPARAGWWAECLIASAPVVGVMPFTVRPDMLGVALQTTGVLLILRALGSNRPGALAVVAGFAAFGLAICIKQHFVGGAVVSLILLLGAWRRRRIPLRLIGGGVLTAVGVVAAVFGIEELYTQGMMSKAIFIAAPATVRVHPTNGMRAAIVLSNIMAGSLSLIALLTCAKLALVASHGRLGQAVAVVGTLIVAVALLMPIVHQLRPSTMDLLVATLTMLACLLLVIPAGIILERRALSGSWIDRALCLFGAAELLIVVPLCRASTGAWVNYAIQGIVFAAILTARSLARAASEARIAWSLIPIGVSALALLGFELKEMYLTFRHLRAERRAVELVLTYLKNPTPNLYFDAGPGRNRVYGRPGLVFDDWLYPVFESEHLAEPRSLWLRRALANGSVRFVITGSDDPVISGLDEPLTSLGYSARFQFTTLYVWEQIRSSRRE